MVLLCEFMNTGTVLRISECALLNLFFNKKQL